VHPAPGAGRLPPAGGRGRPPLPPRALPLPGGRAGVKN